MSKKIPNPKGWRGGRTPYGETDSFDKYIKEWRKLTDALEKLTGLTVTGFDPGISLTEIKDKKYVEGTSFQIPTWFAKRLVEKFDDLELELVNAQRFYPD